jgi:hypothetical protein
MKIKWSKKDGLTIELSTATVVMLVTLGVSAIAYSITYIAQFFS